MQAGCWMCVSTQDGGIIPVSYTHLYNIFADDAWFQENMGDFREKYGLRCVLHGFSVPMKVEEKWAFVSRLVKAKAMQDEPSEIMKNIYAPVSYTHLFIQGLANQIIASLGMMLVTASDKRRQQENMNG